MHNQGWREREGGPPKAWYPVPATGISAPGALALALPSGGARTWGGPPGKQHPGTSRLQAGAPRGGSKMATSREGRRGRAELSQAASSEPTALGGGGKNHSPTRIAPWGRCPGEPRGTRITFKARKAVSPDPRTRSPGKKISLLFYFAKSRPGYPRVGRAAENWKTGKQQNATETAHSRNQPRTEKVHFSLVTNT